MSIFSTFVIALDLAIHGRAFCITSDINIEIIDYKATICELWALPSLSTHTPWQNMTERLFLLLE